MDLSPRRIAQGAGIAGCLAILWISASHSEAAAQPPASPQLLRVGGPRSSINLPENGSSWFRVVFTATATDSHFRIRTEGDVDTCLKLFRDLQSARDDEPLAEDDDSGADRNAEVALSFGYPSPLYLEVEECGRAGGGRVTVASETFFQEPEACDSGGCVFAASLSDRPSGLEVLRLLRDVQGLLEASERGKRIRDLYWEVSGELLAEVLRDAPFRGELSSRLMRFRPVIQAVVAAEEGEPLALSAELLRHAEELKALVEERLSADVAARLDAEYESLELHDRIGDPVRDLWKELGLGEPGAGNRGRRTVLFKLAPHATAELSLRNGQVTATETELNRVFRNHRLVDLRAVFSEVETSSELRRVYEMTLETEEDARRLLRDLGESPEVEWAELDREVHALTRDAYFGYQYGVKAPREVAGGVDALTAWSTTMGDPSILVAVVDTGVDYHHADLVGRVRVDLGHDYADGDNDPMDDHGHGTHVAGIIAAAADNGFAVTGVAPNVGIVPMRVLGSNGSGTASSVAEGIAGAVQAGARVINLSLGSSDFSEVIEESLRFADARGVLVIAAAGNDGEKELSYPARSRYALAIAATDSDAVRAPFSNYGEGLELSGPGVNVVSTWKGGTACYASGTSMAAPHVVGVAALVLSRQPALTSGKLADVLTDTARDLGNRGYDTEYGWGIADAARAVASQSSGPPGGTPPEPPAGAWLRSPALPGFEAKIRITPPGASPIPGVEEDRCIIEALCVSGGLPGRSEIFVKVIGPRPNGKLWVQVSRFSPSEVEVWLRQRATGLIRYYWLPSVQPSNERISGLLDREAFDPTVGGTTGSESLQNPLVRQEGPVSLSGSAAPEPPRSVGWLTAPELPGFRIKAVLSPAGATQLGGQAVGRCIPETLCVSGALADRPEVFVKVIGPRPNGFLWTQIARFTPARVELWIEHRATGTVRYYRLGSVGAGSDDVFGIQDREAFRP